MKVCCCSGDLDTEKDTLIIAVGCIAACVSTFAYIAIGLVFWEPFHNAAYHHHNNISTGVLDEVFDIEISLQVLWWGSLLALFVLLIYIIFCVLMIIGVKKDEHKLLLPWLFLSTILIPLVFTHFLYRIIKILIDDSQVETLASPIIFLLLCCYWVYGFCGAVSQYRMIKEDLYFPASLRRPTYKRAPSYTPTETKL